ncbi:hypothetical protein CF319_g5274 [Tilletia indica]|nr:hypothetical protein CF319_g5274 [Tilletia indica]
MDTQGGFVLPREGEAQQQREAQANNSEAPSRPLTDRQQTRLGAYLDEAFTRISRGFLRRHEPRPSRADGEADWLPTLRSLLAAWISVLGLIARVPPLGSSASLLVSYLLRATSELTEDITGYNLGEQGVQDDLEAQLHAALAVVDALDSIWADLLRGQPLHQHQARLQLLLSSSGADLPPSSDAQLGLSTDPSGRFHHSTTSQASSSSIMHSSFPPPPSTPFADPHHAVSTSVLSQTERIRLRNLALLARDRLFRWMRDVLDAPPPPETDDFKDGATADGNKIDIMLGNGPRVAALLAFDERQRRDEAAARRPGKRRRLNGDSIGGESINVPDGGEDDEALVEQEREFAELAGAQGDLDTGMPALRDEPIDEPEDDEAEVFDEIDPAADGAGGGDLEVVIDEENDAAAQDGEDGYNKGGDEDEGPLEQEHQHYADLFSRKLNPDASDDEDEPGGEDHDDDEGRSSTSASPSKGRRRRRSRSGSGSRSIDSTDARTIDPSALGEVGSSHAVVGQWDLEFSRCFRRTIRLLAESADRAQEMEREREQRAKE